MNRPVKPLHLVERAAQQLRDGPEGGPESVLLPDGALGRIAVPAIGERTAEAPAGRADVTLAVETLEGAGMIPTREQRDRIGEEFRIVGQQVLAGMATVEGSTAQRNVVMVTSARGGEGKSFAALNLAANLALGHDRSIILVDADIGPGSLSKSLGLEAETGLLDLASSPAQLGEGALVRSRIESLSVLPIGGGTDPSGRALISAHHPIAGLVATLARRFTQYLFVIDAPPCLSSSDPAALAAVAGQVLLVVEAEKTRRGEIEAALDLIDSCPNIKLILNKIRLTTRDTFGTRS
ncbi:MAG TPA: P-loop NTPase [Acetobacteraceae bacterium]|nr:P-loop NTPase [Acetobacteraceae bacterium]